MSPSVRDIFPSTFCVQLSVHLWTFGLRLGLVPALYHIVIELSISYLSPLLDSELFEDRVSVLFSVISQPVFLTHRRYLRTISASLALHSSSWYGPRNLASNGILHPASQVISQQLQSHVKAHSNKNASPNQLFRILALSPFTTALKMELIVINQWEAGFLRALRGFTWILQRWPTSSSFREREKELKPHGDLTPSSHMLPTRILTIWKGIDFLGSQLVSFL